MKKSKAIVLSVLVVFMLVLSGPSGAGDLKGNTPAEKAKGREIKVESSKALGQTGAEKAGQKAAPKKDAGQAKNKIIAKVGTYTLTREGLDQRIEALPPQYRQMINQKPEFKQNLIDRWVQIALLAQEARARRMDKDKSVLEKIDEVINTLLAQEYVMRNVVGKINVTDKDVSEYYASHKSEFENPEMVRARHILIKVAHDAKPEQWQEAEKKALDTKKRIDGGEDFAATAKSVSEDPGSKEKGGDLGFFPRGQMVPEFEQAAFSLNSGAISEPVKSKFGYHIIKVEEKRESTLRPLEEVSASIKNSLTEKKQEEGITQLLNDLRKKYNVVVNP